MQRVIKDFTHDEIILNTHYIRAFNKEEKDSLLVVSKNIHTGEKVMREYPEPKVPVFVALPQYKTKDYLEFQSKDKLVEHWVSYRYRVFELARLLKMDNFVDRLRAKQLEAKHIHLDKRLFGSDLHIEDMVMMEFFKFCLTRDENGTVMIDFPKVDHFHLGGLDIETDINVSDEKNEQPVIANTAIDGENWKIVTACLVNPEYKGQQEVMNDIETFKKDFKATLIEHINNIDLDEDDPKKKAKIEAEHKKLLLSYVDKLDLELTFETDEREVIKKPTEFLFKKANPDYCYIYNAKFDIEHMNIRADELGMKYSDLFQFRPDTPSYINFNYRSEDPDPKKREHYYNAYNPTKIVDQLLQYAQLRRGKLFASYSLDAVAKRHIGVSKLDYSKICSYIGDFPYVDFKNFIIYNIIDVFMMLMLDKITNDCYSQVYSRFNLCTEWGRIAKPMKRTVNVFDTLADIQGFKAGNEINSLFVDMKKERLKKVERLDPGLYNVIMQLRAASADDNPYRITGGCVAEPTKVREGTAKNNIYDFDVKRYRKLKNCADLDASSMYPNNIIANNGSKTTLFGILAKLNGVSDHNIAQLGALSLLNENYNSVGHYFFNTPMAEELIKEYYDVKPIYKRRVEEIAGYCDEDLEFDPKNKFFDVYRKLFNRLYQTKYDEKDIEAGAPSLSKYFLSNDASYIRLSYYDTLVEMRLTGEGTFNQMCGFEGKGFICGQVINKDRLIKDCHEDYIATMIPRNTDTKIGELITRGMFSNQQIEEITISKIKPFNLDLNGFKFNAMGRLLFWDISCVTPLTYELYEVINNDGGISDCGVLLKLYSDYEINKNNRISVTQSIMLYKK